MLARTMGRGYFPHQASWLIDNPLRRLLLTPAKLAARLPLTKSSKVLEVGPGSGYCSVELSRRVPQGWLELLDLQPEMLAKAKRKLQARGRRNVGYTTHDASERLPFPNELFDVEILVAVLGEIPRAESCLHELFRRSSSCCCTSPGAWQSGRWRRRGRRNGTEMRRARAAHA